MIIQQLLQQLVSNLRETLPNAGPEERRYITESITIFQRCRDGYLAEALDETVRREILDQVAWIQLYANHQKRYPAYTVSPYGFLVPKADDDEMLFLRFAAETLEGAYALGELLGLSYENDRKWTYIQRHSRVKCNRERSFSNDDDAAPETEDEPGDESENNTISPFRYQYWYF